MLQLRVYGESALMTSVAGRLEALPGMRHVSRVEADSDRTALVTADVRSDAADGALSMLDELGVPPDDIALVRLDTIEPDRASAESSALVWADILGQARLQSHAAARYLVLMATGGVIASLAVLNDSPTLIVGAMAISPDLLPITAICIGLVFVRGGLAVRGLATLTAGLGTAGVFAVIVSWCLDQRGALPEGFGLGQFSASQTHINATTILVALAAGIAGMLAVETRASAAVGVAISVTTIPSTAYLGVALGIGEFRTSLSALAVLGVNVTMMLVGGSLALVVQRAMAARSGRPWAQTARARGHDGVRPSRMA